MRDSNLPAQLGRRRWSTAGRVGAAVLVLLSVAGCRQVLGVEDHRGDPCKTCTQSSCGNEAAACATSTACKGIEDCYGNCQGDARCRAQCTLDHPAGDGVVAGELDACLATHCEAACNLACGALSHLAPPDAAQACQDCLAQVPCDTARACGTDVECQTYVHCREGCSTGDCIGACSPENSPTSEFCYGPMCGNTDCVRPCSADNDGGLTRYANFYRDVSGACQTQCQAGQNWTCLGHVTWPTAKAAPRKFAVAFIDTADPKSPYRQGIVVKMCTGDCAHPFSQTTTDESGLAHLTDTTNSANGAGNGLNGYLDLSSPRACPENGCPGPSPGACPENGCPAVLLPTRVYWGFPLSEPNGALGTPVPFLEASVWTDLWEHGLGVHLDPNMGAIAAVVLDCSGNQAPNVAVSISVPDSQPPNTPYYAPNFVPTQTLTQTGNVALAFFINVTPGQVTVTATPVDRTDPSSVFAMEVVAGKLTEVSLAPTPSPLN